MQKLYAILPTNQLKPSPMQTLQQAIEQIINSNLYSEQHYLPVTKPVFLLCHHSITPMGDESSTELLIFSSNEPSPLPEDDLGVNLLSNYHETDINVYSKILEIPETHPLFRNYRKLPLLPDMQQSVHTWVTIWGDMLTIRYCDMSLHIIHHCSGQY